MKFGTILVIIIVAAIIIRTGNVGGAITFLIKWALFPALGIILGSVIGGMVLPGVGSTVGMLLGGFIGLALAIKDGANKMN